MPGKSDASVSTVVDTNVESMDAMKNAVLDIAKKTPVALSDLTSALYDIRSAGISASMSMDVLEKSAQLVSLVWVRPLRPSISSHPPSMRFD